MTMDNLARVDTVQNSGMDVWSVSRLNQTISNVLQSESLLQGIWLEGEIYNLTYHNSGHIYFSLKDDRCNVSCTFFRGANQKLKGLKLQVGMQIMALGGVSVYQPRGTYQFNVQRVTLAGEGELRIRIEQLKKKLHAEGLFDPERKKDIPFLPLTIGVATASTGAAIQDIIRVARSRFPGVNILLAPCVVQGEGAVKSICNAIEALNSPELDVDVIIAGRGGGSFEDLMAFNEEAVVRAYANSSVPIVSAVGHEIDSPLTDLAADAYAPTPSAAAERVIPVRDELEQTLDDADYRMASALNQRLRNVRERIHRVASAGVYQNPLAILKHPLQRLDWTAREIHSKMQAIHVQSSRELDRFSHLPMLFGRELDRNSRAYSLLAERLDNYSPLGTLQRGYSVVRSETGTVIRSSSELKVDQEVELLFATGKARARITDLRQEW
ncbi:MAG: exodeoxyribonuclease VII large subunit [Leptospiraceae bacterium]|nr:exodeoxyribonuclease VII large subunit [Leptospiraceae bacterium]